MSVLKGVAIGVGLNVVAFLLFGLLAGVGSATSDAAALVLVMPLMAIGLFQLAYLIPAIRHYRRRNEREVAAGIILVAGITFLLNAGCYGLLMTAGFR